MTDRADGWSGYILDLVVAGGFGLGGAEITEGAVQAGAVVPADVLGDCAAGGGPGGPGLQVDQFCLERPEEALGQGVIPALAGAAVRELSVEVVGQLRELSGGVLAAADALLFVKLRCRRIGWGGAGSRPRGRGSA